MLVNKETFNLKSVITDDWGDYHRIALNLEALSTAEDWKLGLELPSDYKIDQIYGAKLTQEGNKTYISGEPSNQSLSQGSKTEIILIIDEGNSGSNAPIPTKFIYADSVASSILRSNSQITEDWQGGYKLELVLVQT